MSASAACAKKKPGQPLDSWHPPPFCRTSWTSEATRETWQPRLGRALDALEDLAVLRCSEDGIRRLIFARPASGERLRELATRCAVGVWSLEAPAETRHGVAAGRCGRIALAIGGSHPPDPRRLSRPAAEDDADTDPVWHVAMSSKGAEISGDGRCVTIAGHWASNPLLASLGLTVMAPWPDSFTSSAWQAEGEALLASAEAHSRAEALGHLREVLSWPVSWTALHGIAEIKTPLFRFIRDTPHTRELLTVHSIGTTMPVEAARGLRFPFPGRHAAVQRP